MKKQTLLLSVVAVMALVSAARADDPEDSLVGDAFGKVELAAVPGIQIGWTHDQVNMHTTDTFHVTGYDNATLALPAAMLNVLPNQPNGLVQIDMTLAFDCLRVVDNRSIQRLHVVSSNPPVVNGMKGMSVGTDNSGTGQPDTDLGSLPAADPGVNLLTGQPIAPCSDEDLRNTVESNALAIKVIVTSGGWTTHDGLPN
jgi:hypothetical protein